MKVSDAKELKLIRELENIFKKEIAGVKQNTGDDAAVVAWLEDCDLVVTVDSFVEGVHYSNEYLKPEEAGYRFAMACISDIAAMGALPLYLLVNLGLTGKQEVGWVKKLYAGLKAASEANGAAIIGGDTVSSGVNFCSLTALGKAEGGRYLSRKDAKADDVILVTGVPGCAAAGLLALEKYGRLEAERKYPFLVKAHVRPAARVKEGLLALFNGAGAMEDISDGVETEAGHITTMSRLGAEIELDKLPVNEELQMFCEESGTEPYELALYGGEDFELMITVAEEKRVKLLDKLKEETGRPVTEIGRMTLRPGIRYYLKGNEAEIAGKGYEHFKKK